MTSGTPRPLRTPPWGSGRSFASTTLQWQGRPSNPLDGEPRGRDPWNPGRGSLPSCPCPAATAIVMVARVLVNPRQPSLTGLHPCGGGRFASTVDADGCHRVARTREPPVGAPPSSRQGRMTSTADLPAKGGVTRYRTWVPDRGSEKLPCESRSPTYNSPTAPGRRLAGSGWEATAGSGMSPAQAGTRPETVGGWPGSRGAGWHRGVPVPGTTPRWRRNPSFLTYPGERVGPIA